MARRLQNGVHGDDCGQQDEPVHHLQGHRVLEQHVVQAVTQPCFHYLAQLRCLVVHQRLAGLLLAGGVLVLQAGVGVGVGVGVGAGAGAGAVLCAKETALCVYIRSLEHCILENFRWQNFC